MKWLITGGCGFLGTRLIKHLIAEGGHSIRVVDDLSIGTREDLRAVCNYQEIAASIFKGGDRKSFTSQVQFVPGNILDEQLALEVAQSADIIVHLAANSGVNPSIQDPRFDCLTNVIGTLNYLESARCNCVKRFIFASSGGTVIGNCTPPIHEEMAPRPVAPYGASKLSGEGYCSAYFRTFGVETVVLRFGNVYGPGSSHKNSVVAKFIRRAIAGDVLEIYGDGMQTRDFIYVDDLIEAILLAATRTEASGEIFQIATSAETAVNELVEKLLPVLAEFKFKPVNVKYTHPQVGEVQRNYADTSKARKLLGWQAKTDLETGLRRTVEWFISCDR